MASSWFDSGDGKDNGFCSPWTREHSRRKTKVFLKSPHLNLASKDFKEAKLGNCFSADSLPVESAQCLRLRDQQNLFKLKLKCQQNLHSNSIVCTQVVRNHLRNITQIGFFENPCFVGFLWKHLFFLQECLLDALLSVVETENWIEGRMIQKETFILKYFSLNVYFVAVFSNFLIIFLHIRFEFKTFIEISKILLNQLRSMWILP